MTLISNLEYGDEFVEWTQKCWKIQGSDHFAWWVNQYQGKQSHFLDFALMFRINTDDIRYSS